MRARYDQPLAPGQKLVMQELRHRLQAESCGRARIPARIAARYRVAHDYQIGMRLQVVFAEGLQTQGC